MAWFDARLNVGWWNLSLGVAAGWAAGCGPLIPIAEESDTDGPNDDDDDDTRGPDSDTEPPHTTSHPTTTPTDTDPSSCDPGCSPGYYCVDGSCIPYDDCYGYNSGGYDYCCYDYCCYDGCYYECYFAEDCSDGSFCGSGYGYSCYAADELPACEPDETIGRMIPLPVEATAGAAALAFGDAEASGGQELLVVHWNEARLVTGGGATATEAIPLPDNLGEASATSTATASGTGFAVSTAASGGTQLLTLEAGALVASEAGGRALTRIVGGDFDGDGIGDVAGLDSNSVYWLQGTGTGFDAASLVTTGAFGPAAPGRLDADGRDDIAFHADSYATAYAVSLHSGGETYELYEHKAAARSVATGDFDGDGLTDIAGLTASGGSVLLFVYANIDASYFSATYPSSAPDLGADADGTYRVSTGDFDGDGADDLIVGSDGAVRVLFGELGGDGLRCYADIEISHAASTMAVGDLDGDGRADVAFSDGTTTSVLARP